MAYPSPDAANTIPKQIDIVACRWVLMPTQVGRGRHGSRSHVVATEGQPRINDDKLSLLHLPNVVGSAMDIIPIHLGCDGLFLDRVPRDVASQREAGCFIMQISTSTLRNLRCDHASSRLFTNRSMTPTSGGCIAKTDPSCRTALFLSTAPYGVLGGCVRGTGAESTGHLWSSKGVTAWCYISLI